MSKSLRYAPAALVDLEEITDYIGLRDPDRALSFVAELAVKAGQAAERPKSFRLRPELGPDIRSAVHRDYVILFRELQETVLVLHVVHGSRNLSRLRL